MVGKKGFGLSATRLPVTTAVTEGSAIRPVAALLPLLRSLSCQNQNSDPGIPWRNPDSLTKFAILDDLRC